MEYMSPTQIRFQWDYVFLSPTYYNLYSCCYNCIRNIL